MQSASAALTSALNNGHSVRAIPKLLVEWNQNRYAGILKVDNDPSDASVGADVENFPIETIVAAQRPKRGIIKARTSRAVATPLFWSRQRKVTTGEEGFTAEDFSDNPQANRYYTVGPDSGYKYWTSPRPSTTAQVGGGFPFPAGYEVRPFVLYKKTARANKIVLTFESTWAKPTAYTVQITTNGGTSWTNIASDVPVDSNGQVILYRHANGSWDRTVDRSAVGTLNGVRILVTSINKASAHLNVIEISARLESDLSEYLIGYDNQFNMSEPNFITPIGQISSNTSSFTLSNFDGLFNNDNTNSIYYQLMDKNALCTLDLEYDLGGGVLERVREFTMYVDQWSGEADLEITASCKDSSKFLQEEKVPNILLENVTVGEAVWRVCDSVGFNDFIYDRKETDPAATLPYFWTDGDRTVWETLQELAQATQTAIYFDEFDTLRIKTGEAAYDLSKTAVWALEATNANGKLADVEEASVVADYEANIVNINYKETKVSDDNKGLPQMHILWQPEETLVLRSSRLAEHLSATATQMRITPDEVATWPFEGMVNIEGELIRYDAKEYVYHNKSGTTTKLWVESNDQKINIDKTLSDENVAYRNTWTGFMRIKERGVYWSSPRVHAVDINGWTGRKVDRDNTFITDTNAGINHERYQSSMRVTAPGAMGADSLYVVSRGMAGDQNYRRYGTRLKIPKVGAGSGGAGIVINLGNAESGYYIEVVRSEVLDANGAAKRNFINEVGFFVRNTSGNHLRVAGKGARALIIADRWYDLDVDFYQAANGNHHITVYLNGVVVQRIVLGSNKVALTGRFGVYQRSSGSSQFEYFFAHSNDEAYRTDEVSQFDKTRGGYVSGQWDREFVYGTRDANRRVGNKTVEYKQKYNQYFMDEMGPIVHEIRELDIIFEKFPVLHSRLYSSNESQIVTPEYNATPFGAKFMIANSSRNNAIANGEDLLSFGKENAVEQRMLIYGRLIFQEEGEVYTAKNSKGVQETPFQNEDSVRRRGRVEVDIDSKWIQSRAEAERLGNWILKHWSGGNDEVQASIFGNPLLQLGDVVTLNYPDKNIFRETHRYFVVAINNSFSNGLSTQLTLRRAKS